MPKRPLLLGTITSLLVGLIWFLFVVSPRTPLGRVGMTIAYAQPELLSCPAEPPEEFGVRPQPRDRGQALLQAALLDSETREASRRHQKLKSAQNQVQLQDLHELLKARKKHLVEAIRHDPQVAWAAILSEQERQELAAFTSTCAEIVETLEGTLEVVVADFFQEGTSQTRYTLLTRDQKRLTLHPVGPLKDFLESRTRVRVKGVRVDDELLFNASRSVAEAQDVQGGIDVIAQPGNPPVLGEQRVAVILANFQNTEPPSITPAEVNEFLTSQLAPYYAENSYGKISVTGDVFGGYTLPIDQTCSVPLSDAIAATDNDIFFPNYSRLVIVAPYGPACSWGGLGSLGKTSLPTADGPVDLSWVALPSGFGTSLGMYAHELGHNFGNYHANFLDCGDATIAPTDCISTEYGDPYDVMGGSYLMHFSAPRKELMGWFEPANLHAVTADGTYVLDPIELPSLNLQALKLQRDSTPTGYMYFEYRQPIGFDTVLSPTTDIYQGGLLHSTPSAGMIYLLDPTPLDSTSTITLLPGASFTDPATGTRVTAVSATPTALTLNVALGKTDFTPPTIAITSPSPGTTLSGSVVVTADASDDSGIEKVEFWSPSLGLLATDTTPPYEHLLDTTHIPNGGNYVYAKAFDLSGVAWGVQGNVETTPWVDFTVANTDSIPPTVTLTAPVDGSTVMNPVRVAASASDDVGIWVVMLGEASSSPFPLPCLDFDQTSPYETSCQLSEGQHTMIAKAYDFVGNVTIDEITVNVDNTPPVHSAIASTSVTGRSATITWTTDEPSDSQVEYGATSAYGSATTLNPTLVTNHSVALRGLTTKTTYHFRVLSKDLAGNLAVSADQTFSTSANSPPLLDSLGNQVIAAGKFLVFPVKASDPDHEFLTLMALKQPAGSSFFPKGDVTQNAVLDAADVNLISACAAGTAQCSMFQVALGDVAGPQGLVPDGKLTAVDAQTVQAMLDERAHPSGDDGLLALLNTSTFLWSTTTADADEYPYTARFRAEDAESAFDEKTAAITVTSSATNLLTNGGFEAGQTDWSGWGTNRRLTTLTAYTGTTAAEIVLGGQPRYLRHADVAVTAGSSYRLRASLKTASLSTSRAYLEVKWRKSGGALIRTDSFGQTSGTTDWKRLTSSTLVAPPETGKVEINLMTEAGSGTAYFDAVRMEKVN